MQISSLPCLSFFIKISSIRSKIEQSYSNLVFSRYANCCQQQQTMYKNKWSQVSILRAESHSLAPFQSTTIYSGRFCKHQLLIVNTEGALGKMLLLGLDLWPVLQTFFKILLDDDTEQLAFKSNKESFCTKFRILNGRGDAGRLALLFKIFAPLNTETTCCMLIYVFTYNGITLYCLELPPLLQMHYFANNW